MIGKYTEAIPGKSWVKLTEMPNGLLKLEGIRFDPLDMGHSYQSVSILFSKEAIRAMLPEIIAWAEADNNEIETDS